MYGRAVVSNVPNDLGFPLVVHCLHGQTDAIPRGKLVIRTGDERELVENDEPMFF